MIVCKNLGRFLLHRTHTKIHPKTLETMNWENGLIKNDVWVKLFSFRKFGFYWRKK